MEDLWMMRLLQSDWCCSLRCPGTAAREDEGLCCEPGGGARAAAAFHWPAPLNMVHRFQVQPISVQTGRSIKMQKWNWTMQIRQLYCLNTNFWLWYFSKYNHQKKQNCKQYLHKWPLDTRWYGWDGGLAPLSFGAASCGCWVAWPRFAGCKKDLPVGIASSQFQAEHLLS